MSHPAAADGTKVLLGRGKIFFNRFTSAGVKTGERFLGNCTKLEVNSEDDTIEIKDSTQAATATLKKVNRERKVKLALTMSEFDKENVALALMGDTTEFTQSAATVTDEAIKSAPADRYIALGGAAGARNLTSVTNVKKGATTYVAGTDYEVDLVLGRIYVKPGGAIAALTHPDDLTCTYVKPAITAGSGLEMVRGAVSSTIEGFLRFVAEPATGPLWDAEIWRVSISPDGGLNLIGDDWGEMSISGDVLSDAAVHPSEPFYRLIKR